MPSPFRYDSTLLLGSNRIFYTGPLRRSLEARRLGALSIYAAPERPFDIRIGDGACQRRRIVAVPAFEPHRIAPPHGAIWNLLIEPETTTPQALAGLQDLCEEPGGDRLLDHLRRAEGLLADGEVGDGLTTEAFDRLLLGAVLPVRPLDGRIVEVLRQLSEEPNDATLSAEACAASVGLSASRLCHLFRAETGVSFRSCKMWRRARRFLDQARGDSSLTDVALGLGYPDSSHFSHSIRRTFGMQPGAMRAGARNMTIRPGADYRLFAA
jgi:AraC-like DNA-binding protein